MVKTKILLVEDDKSLREIYGVRLYSEGYDIISAGDGEEALALAIKERPPLIISDVMMPKISGFDMLDILRSTTETKDIKVIMMTALSSEDQRARGESLGADRYLVKSQVGIEDVVRTVHEVLGDALVAGAIAPPAGPVEPAAPPVAPSTEPAPLPQPTAPFSTNRPASLGDRVIHPPEPNSAQKDFSALMNAELGNTSSATPAATPPEPAPAADATLPPTPAPEDDFDIPPIPASSLEPDTTDISGTVAPPLPAVTPVQNDTPPANPGLTESSAVSGLSFEETPPSATYTPTAPPVVSIDTTLAPPPADITTATAPASYAPDPAPLAATDPPASAPPAAPTPVVPPNSGAQ